MKKISFLFTILMMGLRAFSQQPPMNEPLIPKQHLDDTIPIEPKLSGGALIDTVNIKESVKHQPQYLNDTSVEKNRKGKPKKD